MDETIYLKYLWKNEYIIQAYKYHHQSSKKYQVLSIVYFIIGIAHLLFAFYKIFIEHDFPALVLIFPGIYLLLISKIRFYFYYRNFQRLNYDNKQAQWEIDRKKVIYRFLNVSQSTFSWDLVDKVLDTPEGFLLYPGQNLFYWLPKYAFGSEEDIAQFVYLAKDKVKNWQQIK